MIELIGIIASVLIAASFFLDGEKFIRAVNTVGSVVFIAYGLLKGSFSVVLLNSISVVVNIVKIYKIKKEK